MRLSIGRQSPVFYCTAGEGTDLASLVGARRGWINSILQDWRKRGLIELEAGKITFLDLPRIRHERDSRIAAHFAE